MIYLDTSALLKLVVKEDRSEELLDFIAEHPRLASSALARTELVMAAGRISAAAAGSATALVTRRIFTTPLTDDLLDEAGALRTPGGLMLRALDAIHVTAARRLGADVPLVTYDTRMADVATALGHPVLSP